MNLLAINHCSLCWAGAATASVSRGHICEACMLAATEAWIEAKAPNADYEPATVAFLTEAVGNGLCTDEIAERLGCERRWITPVLDHLNLAPEGPF